MNRAAQAGSIPVKSTGDVKAVHGGSNPPLPIKPWHCAKCGKPMQFMDGMCWDCFGGDPGQ